MNSKHTKWFFLLVLALIWGSSFILIKRGLVGLTPFQLGSLRIIFAAVFLLAIGFKTLPNIPQGKWKYIVITSLFGPLILMAFSQKNHHEVKKIVLNNSLIVGLITTILVSLIISFSNEFLSLWLGNNFEKYSNWLIFKLIDLPFYASAGMYAFVYRAWNLVKIPAIFTLIIGIINITGTYMICVNSNKNLIYIYFSCFFNIILA
jgi:hypothetical protein